MITPKIENRRHFRQKMLAEVSYKDHKNQSFGGCTTKDISECGVCIQIKEFFALGAFLDLQFKLPLSATMFYVQGRVMRINKMAYGDRWEVGLEIVNSAEYVRLVKKYIAFRNTSS